MCSWGQGGRSADSPSRGPHAPHVPPPHPHGPRPPLLLSLQDFLNSLDAGEEGEASSPTRAMTQHLKPHPGEGAPKTRGERHPAGLRESGPLQPRASRGCGASPGQERVGRVPLPRAGAPIADHTLLPGPTLTPCPQAGLQEVQVTSSAALTRGPQKSLKSHHTSAQPKPTQCSFCGPRSGDLLGPQPGLGWALSKEAWQSPGAAAPTAAPWVPPASRLVWEGRPGGEWGASGPDPTGQAGPGPLRDGRGSTRLRSRGPG